MAKRTKKKVVLVAYKSKPKRKTAKSKKTLLGKPKHKSHKRASSTRNIFAAWF